MKTKAWIVLGLLCPVTAVAQSNRGSTVEIRPLDGVPYRGELIAINSDSVWIFGDEYRVADLSTVTRISVDHGKLGAKMGWNWGLAAGLISGTLLTAACLSVSDAECGGVFFGVLSWFALTAGLAHQSMQSFRYEVVSSPSRIDRWRALVPHARFPQGPLPGFDPRPQR
ncbi:MAG: hypothetical protein ACE5FJ_01295 [Gemmatimonadales bacterium]